MLFVRVHSILSDRSDFYITDNLSMAVHAFAMGTLTSLSVDEIMLPWYVNLCYIIAEGFFFILSFFVGYILSFGLVRLRTFRLSARVGAHIEHRCSRLRGDDVTITDVTLKNPDRQLDVNDVMPRSDGLGFLGILKKAIS